MPAPDRPAPVGPAAPQPGVRRTAERHGYLLHAVYGRPLPPGVEPAWGSTEHLDLHWGSTGERGQGVRRRAPVLHGPRRRRAGPRRLVAAADIVVNMAYYRDPVNLCPALHRLAAQILG
jgi:hypothetical protein